MKKKYLLIILLANCSIFSQIKFSEANPLIDLTNYSNNVTALTTADLNNDGFKELIVASYYDNKVMFYKNINGDLQHHQRQIISFNPTGSYHSNFDVKCKDLDNDGLIDVVISNDYEDKIAWFKNNGNYNFSTQKVIDTSIDKPTSIIIEDIDKDGNEDIIVGSKNDKEVTLLKNNGNATAFTKTTLYTSSYGISRVLIKDLDNNGFLDIISGNNSGVFEWVKNYGGNSYSDKLRLSASSGDGFEIDFLDINNDSFLDVFLLSNYDDNISYQINNNGNSFSDTRTIIGNTVEDLYNFKIVDFDKDGLKDIIASTKYSSSKIGWFKQNKNKKFSNFETIEEKVYNVKHFLTEDLENNDTTNLITASSKNNDLEYQKISIFNKVKESGTYKEKIINFYISAANVVKTADLDNDGKEDIISGFNVLLWNKNLGNNQFSSQRIISDKLSDFIIDIAFLDFDSDEFTDIITSSENNIKIYKNNNGETFELTKTISFENFTTYIELSDIDGDNLKDILVSHQTGNYPISKIINKGNFNFEEPEFVYPKSYGDSYLAFSFKCDDMDNDGDIDIVVGESNISRLIWLENDGNATFTPHEIATSTNCDNIEIGDINKNGSIEIITSGDNNYSKNEINLFSKSIHLQKTNSNYTKTIIDTQSLQSLVLGDINNDGYLDILGTSYEYYSPYDERILCYEFNGSFFNSKINIESLGSAYSLDKNISLGDLNNDNKLDIVTSYYFINTVKYFLNESTTLSLEIFNKNKIEIFPNPFNDKIRIKLPGNQIISTVDIYDFTGKKVKNFSKTNIDYNLINLKSGLYIIKITSDKNKTFIRKILKKQK